MNDELIKNNFLVLKQLVNREEAIDLGLSFKDDSEDINFAGDPQAENSHSVYNYKKALELLCELTPEVSNAIGETVLPTYTYGRIYKEGSVLEKHKDRPACEISLTLNLGGDKDWSIWVENVNGNSHCVNLEPGDAMVYLGCVAPHWRDEFEGSWYAQFFLHYVRSNGPCREFYFDKDKSSSRRERVIIDALIDEIKNDEPVPENLINKYAKGYLCNKDDLENSNFNDLPDPVTEMKLETESDILKILSKKESIFKKKKEKSVTLIEEDSSPEDSPFVRFDDENSKAESGIPSLDHYIKVYKSILPEKLCDKILNEYVTTDLWGHAMTGGGLDQNARNCDVIGISCKDIIAQNHDYRLGLDSEIYNCVHIALDMYEKQFAPKEGLCIEEDTGYELLRYKEGQFYVQHTDHFKENPRVISCSICLNDDYEGGEFAFFGRKIKIKLGKGDILMFPSSFMYPHEVMPVTKGNRYNIITWLV